MNNRIFLLLVFSFAFYVSQAQKKFTVNVIFPQNIDHKNISFHYDNGKETYLEIKPNFHKNKVTVTGIFYSRYATIYIDYMSGRSGLGGGFWITDKPASIKYLINNDSIPNPLKNFKLTHAYSLKMMGEERVDDFCAKENNDFIDFITRNNGKMNDSLVKIAFEKSKTRNKRYIDFIRNNGNSYFTLWLFKNKIMTDYDANPDTLLKIYHTIFQDSLKNSFEGREIVKYLKGRTLNIDANYVNFTAKDIKGKIISLNTTKSRYVLLTFWASWCGPCIKEIPIIKRLKNQYLQDRLEVISVTWDSKLNDFMKAVKKYNMNWVHIFGDTEISKSYGVIAVPDVFLIDILNKKIIYRSNEDDEFKLDRLERLMAQ